MRVLPPTLPVGILGDEHRRTAKGGGVWGVVHMKKQVACRNQKCKFVRKLIARFLVFTARAWPANFLDKNTPFPETRQNLKGPTMLCKSCSQLICLVSLDKIIIRVIYYVIKGDINFISNFNCQVNHVWKKRWSWRETFTQNYYSCSDWLKTTTSA